jgi:hypothetical protein
MIQVGLSTNSWIVFLFKYSKQDCMAVITCKRITAMQSIMNPVK